MGEVSTVRILLSAAGGLLLGLLYFAALWWTVRGIPTARRPALLVGGSFLIRALAASAGIVLLSGGQPLPLAVAVAGFLVGRTILIRVVGAPLSVSRPAGQAAAESRPLPGPETS